MGGMAVRDGSFLRDGAVFPIDCDEFESLLSSHANRVVESARNLIATEVCEFYIFGLVLATGPGQTTSIR